MLECAFYKLMDNAGYNSNITVSKKKKKKGNKSRVVFTD